MLLVNILVGFFFWEGDWEILKHVSTNSPVLFGVNYWCDLMPRPKASWGRKPISAALYKCLMKCLMKNSLYIKGIYVKVYKHIHVCRCKYMCMSQKELFLRSCLLFWKQLLSLLTAGPYQDCILQSCLSLLRGYDLQGVSWGSQLIPIFKTSMHLWMAIQLTTFFRK